MPPQRTLSTSSRPPAVNPPANRAIEAAAAATIQLARGRAPGLPPVQALLNAALAVHPLGRAEEDVVRIGRIEPHRAAVAVVEVDPGLAAILADIHAAIVHTVELVWFRRRKKQGVMICMSIVHVAAISPPERLPARPLEA